MNIFALFILAASLLATIWAGKVELWVGALVLFGAAALSDLVGIASAYLSKSAQARAAEVTYNGMAQGSIPQGVRDEIWRAARQAGFKTPGDGSTGKAN